jgi:shikimate kinase
VIYLRAGIDDLLLRTQNDKNRPLLQTADPRAKLESLFAQRDPLYREVADIIIDTSRQNVHLLVSRLLQKLAHHSPCPSTPLPGASPHDHA